MAAYSLTASSVKLASTRLTPQTVTAAEAIAAGQAVTHDGYIVDPANTAKLNIKGVAIQSASQGGTVVLASNGDVISFSNTVTFPAYVFADSSGNLQYTADLTSGDRIIRVGLNITANSMLVDIADTTYSKA